jgi:hypothetical protein
MSCLSNFSDINETFIVEPVGAIPSLTACTGVYTDAIIGCSGNTQIFMGTGVITFDGNIYTNDNITASTINASTFYSAGTNIIDIINNSIIDLTGGTFNNTTDTLSLYNNKGGVVKVTGFTDYYTTGATLIGQTVYFDRNDMLSAYTLNLSGLSKYDIYTTGVTFSGNQIVIARNDGQNLNTFINTFTGLTINGTLNVTDILANSLSANTISATTFYGDGSHLTGVSKLDTGVTGFTYSSNTFTISDSTGGTFSALFDIVTGLTVNGTLSATSNLYVTGASNVFGSQVIQSSQNGPNYVSKFKGLNTGGIFAIGVSNNPSYGVTNDILNYTENGYLGYTISSSNVHFNIISQLGTFVNSLVINEDGTVNIGSDIIVKNGLTANTISATTYYNLPTDIRTTGATYSSNTFTFTNNTGGTYSVIFNTVTGLTATTISATTYQNLPLDIRTTGATYSSNTFTYTNNTGGTYSVLFNTLTGLTVNGALTITGNTSLQALTATTVSATTYYNLPKDVYITGGTYTSSTGTAYFTNNTGKTFNVQGFFKPSDDIYTTGFTFDPSTYNLYIKRNGGLPDLSQSLAVLATDLTITGGTYNPNTGVATFTNNTGGTFNVSGFTSGLTDTIINGFNYTPSANTFTITQTNGSAFTATINSVSGLTVNNGLSANTISATTYYNLPKDIYVTGGTYSAGTAYFTNNTGGTFNVSGFSTSIATAFTGGTVSGATIFQSGLTANTISATTYYNLPKDVFVTGGTYSAGTAVFTNNTGGTFNVSGFSTNTTTAFTGGTVSGATIFQSGLTANTISATTYYNLPTDIRTTGATYSSNTFTFTNNTGGTYSILFNTVSGLTVNGSLSVTGNTSLGALTATSVSATTYYNLPKDVYVTGGTYSAGTTTFTNNTGGTFSVSGFNTTTQFTGGTVSGSTIFQSGLTANTISATTYYNLPTDIRTTGATYSSNTFTYTNNTGGTYSVLFNTVTGLTVNGNLSVTGNTSLQALTATTISATSYSNLPLDIRTTGATYSSNIFTYTNNTGGTYTVLFNTLTGLTVNGNLTVTGNTNLGTLTATSISAETYNNLPNTLYTGNGTLSSNRTVNIGTNTLNFSSSTYLNAFVLSSGNVGIGKVSPSYKLDVNGDINFPATTGSTYGIIRQGGVGLLHTYGSTNLFLGINAGNFTTSGTGNNIGIGPSTLINNTTGFNNISIGNASLRANTEGYDNIGIGIQSLQNNTSGYTNIGLGNYSLFSNTAGTDNIAVGFATLSSNTTGYANIAISRHALQSNVSGLYNIALGLYALDNNIDGNSNTAIGISTLRYIANNSDNIGIGTGALGNLYNGNNNTAIGNYSLANLDTGNYNVALGINAGAYQTSGDYQLHIASYDGVSGYRTLIYGEFNNRKVGINTTTATNTLTVSAESQDPLKLIGVTQNITDQEYLTIDTEGVVHKITAPTKKLIIRRIEMGSKIISVDGDLVKYFRDIFKQKASDITASGSYYECYIDYYYIINDDGVRKKILYTTASVYNSVTNIGDFITYLKNNYDGQQVGVYAEVFAKIDSNQGAPTQIKLVNPLFNSLNPSKISKHSSQQGKTQFVRNTQVLSSGSHGGTPNLKSTSTMLSNLFTNWDSYYYKDTEPIPKKIWDITADGNFYGSSLSGQSKLALGNDGTSWGDNHRDIIENSVYIESNKKFYSKFKIPVNQHSFFEICRNKWNNFYGDLFYDYVGDSDASAYGVASSSAGFSSAFLQLIDTYRLLPSGEPSVIYHDGIDANTHLNELSYEIGIPKQLKYLTKPSATYTGLHRDRSFIQVLPGYNDVYILQIYVQGTPSDDGLNQVFLNDIQDLYLVPNDSSLPLNTGYWNELCKDNYDVLSWLANESNFGAKGYGNYVILQSNETKMNQLINFLETYGGWNLGNGNVIGVGAIYKGWSFRPMIYPLNLNQILLEVNESFFVNGLGVITPSLNSSKNVLDIANKQLRLIINYKKLNKIQFVNTGLSYTLQRSILDNTIFQLTTTENIETVILNNIHGSFAKNIKPGNIEIYFSFYDINLGTMSVIPNYKIIVTNYGDNEIFKLIRAQGEFYNLSP